MASINQNYANLLTLRFYNALYAPPVVKPSELPNLSVFSKKSATKGPVSCSGKCLQTKLSKIDITIKFTEDSFGDETTSLQEYKRCLNAVVTSTINEEETSECFTAADYASALDRYGLGDGNPYRAFALVPSTNSTDSVTLSGESFIIRDAGSCDYCLHANKLCTSTKNRSYTQTHKVCQNRIGKISSSPGPNFPNVSPEIQEFRSGGYDTSWIFREALLGFVNSGGLQFETNCGCEETPPTKPVGNVSSLESSMTNTLSGRTTISTQGTQPSRSVSTRSTSGGGSY